MEEFKKLAVDFETKDEVCQQHGAFESRAYKFGERVMHWSACPACADEERQRRERLAEEKEASIRQQRLEARMNTCGIPLRYRAKTFASFIADTDEKEKALSIAMEFAANFKAHSDKGSMMVFSGLPGTGKSHLAIAIAQEVLKGTSALYISAIDAVRKVRDTWRRGSEQTESQVLGDFASIGLLVLDEVGVQYGTEAEQVTLFDIIDKRYRDLMPTILLTNLNRAGMKDFLGDRSYDRLREGGAWVKFDWESQRNKAMAA